MSRSFTPSARRPHLWLSSFLALGLPLFLQFALGADTALAVETKWVRTFTGGIDTADRGYAVAVGPDGNVVAAGMLQLDGGGGVSWLRKYSPAGKLLWGKRITVGRQKISNSASGVAVTPDGSIYVCGSYHEKVSGYNDIWLARYTGGGDLLWRRTWGAKAGLNDQARAVAAGDGGQVYVTGASVGAEGNYDLLVLKYDSAGNRLWARRFDGAEGRDDAGTGVAVAPDGSVYVSGRTQYDSSSYQTDIWLLKLLPGRGRLEWVRQVHGYDCPSEGTGVAVTTRGQVYVSGTLCTDSEGLNGWLAKYRASGTLLWDVEFDSSSMFGDAFLGVSVTPRNAPVVTGYGGSSSQDYYLVAMKYSTKGDFAWSARYMGVDQEESFGRAVAVAPTGASFVVGDVDPVTGNDDVVLLKLK